MVATHEYQLNNLELPQNNKISHKLLNFIVLG